jgi:hypothetical protein
MATAYRAPEGYEAPVISYRDDWQAIEASYLERLAALCREQGSSDLLGEVIRFPYADGYAQYMVYSTSPLQLIHLEIGDAWSIDQAHIRGLRGSDVREKVEHERRLKAALSERAQSRSV